MVDTSDIIISMGCGVAEACPALSIPAIDWQLDDPEGQPLEKIRLIRDEIRDRVEILIIELQTRKGKVYNAK